MPAQRRVQPFEHHARLDADAARRDIERDDAVHVFAAIEDERTPDGLAALRGAAAARQHRHALLARDLDGRGDILAPLSDGLSEVVRRLVPLSRTQ